MIVFVGEETTGADYVLRMQKGSEKRQKRNYQNADRKPRSPFL